MGQPNILRQIFWTHFTLDEHYIYLRPFHGIVPKPTISLLSTFSPRLQGGSPNFHYLVLQRCATGLPDAMDAQLGRGSDPVKHPLGQFGLTTIQSVKQLLNAVAFLHSNYIGELPLCMHS